jgi:3-hydroxyisobutyrate dehydrogenase-like beta-hydroxyacid dehydrogenase
MKIGFIGLGQMGTGIAQNLIKAGHNLVVYNRTKSKADALKPLGAGVATTPAEAATAAEIVMTMMADDHALEAVAFGAQGFLPALAADAIHISLSTISVALSRRLASVHKEQQQQYVSATVFGRPDAAAAAKLFVVAAGATAQLDRCQPLLEVIGQTVFRVGDDPVAANVIKLAGNFMITTVIESMAEACALMRKSGVAPETFLDVMTNSLFNAPIYKTYGPMVASGNFGKVGFALPLGLKDNRLVLAAAEEAAAPMPMASLIHDRFIAAIARGFSNEDWVAFSRGAMSDAGL